MVSKFAFDSFLTKLPEGSPESAVVRPEFVAPPAASAAQRPPSGGFSPVDFILLALKTGPKGISEFAPQFGNSVGLVLDTFEKLVMLGYVRHNDGDKFTLTPAGEAVAASLPEIPNGEMGMKS